jgi:DNA-directed RNA polymerase specialized sigma24 family protein
MREEEGSVTQWITRLRGGDHGAAELLWRRYFTDLVRKAQHRLRGVRRAAADEEDVALSVFNSFCGGVQEGRFPNLRDRDDLWGTLLMLTDRKAVDFVRREQAAKRGGGKKPVPLGAGVHDTSADSAEGAGLSGLPGREPTPDYAALVAEECERLLRLLGDERLRELAIRKLEGYTNEEIARLCGCSLRAVERKLRLIRTCWQGESPP